jgi:hypothetical protein
MHSLYFRVLAGLVCSLFVLQSPVFGQSSIGLTIQVIEGDKAQNIVREDVAKRLTVRIMDRTGRPLQGATVQFALPEFGPGGEFVDAANPVVVSTNGQGIAVAPQFRANSSPGTYEIQVLASYMGEVTRMLVNQSNVLKKKSSNTKLIILSALAGGAAAAAFAARGGSPGPSPAPGPTPSPGPTTPPTITFQSSSVGAPQ